MVAAIEEERAELHGMEAQLKRRGAVGSMLLQNA